MAYAILLNTTKESVRDYIKPSIEEEIYVVEQYDPLYTNTKRILTGTGYVDTNIDSFCRNYDELNSDGVITFIAIGIEFPSQIGKVIDIMHSLVSKSSGRQYDYAPPRIFGYVLNGEFKAIYHNDNWDNYEEEDF